MEAGRTCPLMMVGPPCPTFPFPFLVVPLLSIAFGRGVSVTRAADMLFAAALRGCLSVLGAAKLVLGLLHGSTVLRPSISGPAANRDTLRPVLAQAIGLLLLRNSHTPDLCLSLHSQTALVRLRWD